MKKNCISSKPKKDYDDDYEVIKPDKIHPLARLTDVNSLIDIKNERDVIEKRQKLIQYIWKNKDLPDSKIPDKIQHSIKDDRYSDLNNIKKIDKLIVKLDYKINSIVYHFHPLKSKNNLIIYHYGSGDFVEGKHIIQFFLDNGYSVLAFSMPLSGVNNQPVVDLPRFGKMKLTIHDALEFLKSDKLSPIKFFVEPIAVCLNYAEKKFNYKSISMMGIDEGGWVTTLYSAIDTRISKSYPVCGTLPFYLSSISPYPPGTWGDYESTEPELLLIVNYLELYILGSYGDSRKQMQILNKDFGGINYRTYEKKVKEKVTQLAKGSFEIYFDESLKDRKISNDGMNVIIDDLKNNKEIENTMGKNSYVIVLPVSGCVSGKPENPSPYDPEKIHPLAKLTNVGSLIEIRNENDVVEKRQKLIQYLWKDKSFPYSKMPKKVEKDIKDKRCSDFKNLARIDKITVAMEYGMNSVIYHFHPVKGNNKLILYHQGHDGDFITWGKRTVKPIVEYGYSVMAFAMPLRGMNSRPIVDLPRFGKIKMTWHDPLEFMKSEKLSPIKFFIEPVHTAINYTEKRFNYKSICMVGLSGGGWTTTLCAAVDTRISKSYPVAGTLPMYLRLISLGGWGDYEQIEPELLLIANYLEQYVLGAYGKGRKQIQILNKYDHFFGGCDCLTYGKVVEERVASLGKGAYQLYLDNSHIGHKISDVALEVIIGDIENEK